MLFAILLVLLGLSVIVPIIYVFKRDWSEALGSLGLYLVISLVYGFIFVFIPTVGYSTAPDRTDKDDRFIVQNTSEIHEVEFSTMDNKYIVTHGEGRSKGVDKVSEILDGDQKEVLTGFQREVPWMIYFWEFDTPHDEVYIFPHDEIEFIK